MKLTGTPLTARLAVFATLGLFGASSTAAPLVVANPSFELPTFTDAVFGQQFITSAQQGGYGWTFTDASGIYNPPANDYAGAGASGIPAGADGSQAAFSVQRYVLFQTLAGTDGMPGNGDDPVLTALTTYTLTLSIGQRLPGNQYGATYGGYVFELLAGPTVIAQETNAITPTPGTFVERTITVDGVTLSANLYGQPLTIRIATSASGTSDATDFDNVRLGAITVPEPSAAWLITVAALGLLVSRRPSCRIHRAGLILSDENSFITRNFAQGQTTNYAASTTINVVSSSQSSSHNPWMNWEE